MTLTTSGIPDPYIIDTIFSVYNITEITGDINQADAVALFRCEPGTPDTTDGLRTHAIKNRLMILHDHEPVYPQELSLFTI